MDLPAVVTDPSLDRFTEEIPVWNVTRVGPVMVSQGTCLALRVSSFLCTLILAVALPLFFKLCRSPAAPTPPPAAE